MKTKRFVAVFAAVAVLLAFNVSASSGVTTISSNTIRNIDGWDVEYWRDGGTGTMTFNGDGTFSCTWDARPANNILFRVGRKFGTPSGITQSHTQIGEISLTFDAAHDTSVNSLLCVYGWTARDTVEYYIFESWGTYQKGRQSPQAQLIGTYTVDGEGTYEFYVSHERVNQPSIFSNSDTFPQYYSIRTERRTGGTVSVSEHFRQWEQLGYSMSGALYEVAICIEAWGSAGSGRVNSFSLTVDGITIGGSGTEPAPPEPIPSPAPSTLTTADALNILRHIAGVAQLTSEQRTRYGLSGEITTADALSILRIIAGIN
ncbi:MAG: glycoside hydrolase family 11 protein [Oscillospiraceae bacterium]|jgi:endo-1,4-beta-xylanase|nr:glycoside hydrolase family 11 protein [Oscillospiraceae bacterium]